MRRTEGSVKQANETTGEYADWNWDQERGCFVYHSEHKVYPSEDGLFTASSDGVWLNGLFSNFAEAEKAALRIK